MHIKEFKYFNQKNGFSALRNMIQVFHPGSGSRVCILTFYLSQIPILDPRSQIQGSKRQRIPDPGSRTRIRNTGDFGFAQAVGGSIGYWLSTGAAVLRTHWMDQLSEAFMCKKEFSVYFIFTSSLKFLLFLSYDALRICFLTHLVLPIKLFGVVTLFYYHFTTWPSFKTGIGTGYRNNLNVGIRIRNESFYNTILCIRKTSK